MTFALLHCPFLFLVYCIFVMGMVGLCCKPQPLVIVIIIIVTRCRQTDVRQTSDRQTSDTHHRLVTLP